jgi:cytochrome b561
MSESKTGYSGLQIAIHWIVALLILGAFLTREGMGRALSQRIQQDLSGFDGATLHTIFGGAAFAFILVRIVVRLKNGAPEHHGKPFEQMAVIWGHRLLYLLMIVVPALGAASWYGKMGDLGDLHEIAGKAMFVVVAGHVAMAIYHHVVKKDGTLTRIIKPEAN